MDNKDDVPKMLPERHGSGHDMSVPSLQADIVRAPPRWAQVRLRSGGEMLGETSRSLQRAFFSPSFAALACERAIMVGPM